MNIVAISTLAPQHRFVLSKLHDASPLRHLIQPVWSAKPASWRQYGKLLHSPFSVINRRLQSRYRNWRDDRLYRTLAERLEPAAAERFSDVEQSLVAIDDFNRAANVDLIRQLQPDVIVTSGCPILKPEIFGLARLATINIHWGIAPDYRGENTLFWPLYHNDEANVGVTIHKIDAGIDTGPILAHGFVDCGPEDGEASVTVKAAQVAARLLPGIVAKIEETQSATGQVSTEAGTLYLGRQRTWRHDLTHWWRRRRASDRRTIEAHDEIYIDKPASGLAS
ncbi:formyl transferase [Blastopirellula retiformator]|uniref:formyl transferase n=1 Tax=Blastopirellula retiformator TaxID=2527970 RepID=UPI0016491D7D|nr:formyl transferase [Blastopirellula retiformator]